MGAPTAAKPLVLPKGGWIVGQLEADYETTGSSSSATMAGAPPGARVLDLTLLRARVANAKRSPPPVIQPHDARPITQQTLPSFIDFGEVDERGALRVHTMTLHDVLVVNYRADALVDELIRARGVLRGTVYARVSKKPWTWGRIFALLFLLLLLLAMLFALSQCAWTQPIIGSARNHVKQGYEGARDRWLERGAVDADAKLVADATKGASRGGNGAGTGSGTGTGAGAGAGGTGTGVGTGGGANGTGVGAGNANGADANRSNGNGGANANGVGANADGGGNGNGSGNGSGNANGNGNDSGSANGNGNANGDQNGGQAPDLLAGGGGGGGAGAGEQVRRFSVDEALDDPAQFFARCGAPLYLSGDLLFDYNSSTIRRESLPLLRRLARLLKESHDPKRALRVVGHADETGGLSYNDSLSEKRAQVVADWLVDNGPKNTAFVVEGRGKREPIVPRGSAKDLQRLNRRVEVVVQCP